MTHLHGKRSPRPGHGRVVAAVIGLVAALCLGSVGTAKAAALTRYPAAGQPYAIRASGATAVAPFGSDPVVASDRTVTGVGDTGEIVHGELRPNPGTSDVVIGNLTIRDAYADSDEVPAAVKASARTDRG